MSKNVIVLTTNNPEDTNRINNDILKAKINSITHINNGSDYKAVLVADNSKKCFIQEIEKLEWKKINNIEYKTVFLFTGQGSQYVTMGLDLYKNNLIFKEFFDKAVTEVNKHINQNLFDIIFTTKDCNLIDQTEFTQPSLFALEYALAKTWLAYGITPDIVMGHSVGEFAAATISKAISLEAGAALICNRARLMQKLPKGGTMAALMTDLDMAQSIISTVKEEFQHIGIAAINAPKQTVISGQIEAVQACITIAKEQKIKARELVVSHAFHSSLMQPMLNEFKNIANNFEATTPKTTLISNLTGSILEKAPDANYWCEHILNPVNFLKSINNCNFNNAMFIEIGPNPILITMAKKSLTCENALYLESLNSKQAESIHLLHNLKKALMNN
jgi:acyl transferase domain-containing protein